MNDIGSKAEITQEDGIRKRRYFTKEQKRIILDGLDSKGMTLSLLARKYDLHPVTLYQWRRQMNSEKKDLLEESREELLKENQELKKKVENLTKALGESAEEKHILKTAVNILKKKHRFQQLQSQKKPWKK